MWKPVPTVIIIVAIIAVVIGRVTSDIPLWIAGFALLAIGAVLIIRSRPKPKAAPPPQEQ